MQNMVASLTVQKWQWHIKPETGLPAFNVAENFKGTWSDMIYRTSVYNYFGVISFGKMMFPVLGMVLFLLIFLI